MSKENRFDPKLIGEFFNLSRNMAEAPMKVSVPHDIDIGSTQFDVVYKLSLIHI